jgi:hypothetical protein
LAERVAFGVLLAPVAASLSVALFVWLLGFAHLTTAWLNAKDVIGATNGPALGIYSVGLKHLLPLPVAGFLTGVTASDRDMLRNHVATFYLGWREQAHYIRAAYPALYDSLSATGE